MIALALLAPALLAAAAAPPGLNPAAADLFERDSELKAWALSRFDLNGDGWLTSFEAQPALQFFKDIADVDRDGRVTVREYGQAKAVIAAHAAEVAVTTTAAPAPAER